MYTNVGIEESINIALKSLKDLRTNLYGLTLLNIKQLLSYILKNNFFEFEGNFFLQHRGLAMGSRIAPILAIIALDRVEKLTLFSSNLFSIPFYKHCVDDSLILLNSTGDALNNSRHPTIQFELENPATDNSIAILDCKIQILDDGSLKQPTSLKNSCVRSKFRRAGKIYKTAPN